MSAKVRIDQLLVERGLTSSREKAKASIMAGLVTVDGVRAEKPGHTVPADAAIVLKGKEHPYVSRGGLKLEYALEAFKINPAGKICLDVGASTGGFTDCLLQRAATKVWAVDVGTNQLAYKLRSDDRVVSLEKTNVRELDLRRITDPIDLLVSDVSFISLTLAIPPVLPLLHDDAILLLLVKPQFEAGRGQVGKGGIVKDEKVRIECVNRMIRFFAAEGLHCWGVAESPVMGRKGNIEYLLHLEFAKPYCCGRILDYQPPGRA